MSDQCLKLDMNFSNLLGVIARGGKNIPQLKKKRERTLMDLGLHIQFLYAFRESLFNHLVISCSF